MQKSRVFCQSGGWY